MADLSYPSLYQINTRVWLTELSQAARLASGGHRRFRVAITGYTVHKKLAGDAALARLRDQLPTSLDHA
jgi:hypothetical protein